MSDVDVLSTGFGGERAVDEGYRVKVRFDGDRRYFYLDKVGRPSAVRAQARVLADEDAAVALARARFATAAADGVAAVAVLHGARRVLRLGVAAPAAFDPRVGYAYLVNVTSHRRGVFHVADSAGVFGRLTAEVLSLCAVDAALAGIGGPARWTVHATSASVSPPEPGFVLVRRAARGRVVL